MKMTSHVLKFAQDNKLEHLFKAFGDLWNHQRSLDGVKGLTYSEVDANGVKITFDQKNDEMNKMFAKEVMRLAGITDFNTFSLAQFASHPLVNFYGFAVIDSIVEYILPDTIIQSTGMYTDVRTGGFGDNFKFEVKPRDLFPVTKSSFGKRQGEFQKQFNNNVTLTPEPHSITVAVSFYRVLAGKENLSDFVMKAVRSMEYQIMLDTYTAFNTAMTGLPTTPVDGELKFTGYSQENLIKLIQRVTAWNQGSKAIVLGTQLALRSVLPDDANYRYMLSGPGSEYTTLGYVPNIFGADVIMLPQVANWAESYKMALDDSRIYVISPGQQKLVKLCLEGQVLTNTFDFQSTANLTSSTTMQKSWIAGAVSSSLAGLILLS